MESVPLWQALSLTGVLTWVAISSFFNVTQKLRSLTQPWVTRHVIRETRLILQIQKFQHAYLDAFFSGLSCVVSVPFYTAFLPLLFWVISRCPINLDLGCGLSLFGIIRTNVGCLMKKLQSGHGKLARQMTLLMAFCDYTGNCIKDVISAPRPSSPPVRIVTATDDEKENALEYGLPSSHTLNTVCLSGYLLHYILSYTQGRDASTALVGVAAVCLLVGLIGLGRIYLGMHCLIDILSGLALGLGILAFWLVVHECVDSFVVSGENVTSFWATLSFLLLFAYPTPEFPTPSFEYHTAFNGVALGIVTGVQQTYHQFHHENVARVFTPQLTIPIFAGRMLVGIPAILVVKFCSKALAKWSLPIVSHTLGIPIRSSGYIPTLKASVSDKKANESKQQSYLQKLLFFSYEDSFDVDTGIRFVQYAGLAWSVVDLVPSLFSHLSL